MTGLRPRLAAAVRRLIERIPEIVRPRACALGGALVGLAADWYGLLAGFLIGAMLDEARTEAAARSAIAGFLRDPDRAFPPEPVAGIAAAAALALGGHWPGASTPGEDGELFARLAEALSPDGREPRRRLARILDRILDDGASRAAESRPAMARALAIRGSGTARLLLADFAYALAARAGDLNRERELALRGLLADCGLSIGELAAARERAFPGYRDPWDVLGLEPGSSIAQIKKAYRSLSRKLHPDALGGADSTAFRQLKEAYEELSNPPGPGASRRG